MSDDSLAQAAGVERAVRLQVARDIREERETYVRAGGQSDDFLFGLAEAEQIARGGEES
jgi:hypothetical protein